MLGAGKAERPITNNTTTELTTLYRFDVVYGYMAAASEEATGRGVRYCGICKGDKEVIGVENVSQIEKLMTLVCEHKIIEKLLLVNEKMSISEDTAWVILNNPVAEIRKAVDDKDYFKTVAYACSVFEYCGQQILFWHSKMTGEPLPTNKKKKRKKMWDDWTLSRIIDELSRREIIKDDDVVKLHCIRGLRNEFVHEDYSIKLTSKIAEKIYAHNEDIINYTVKLKAVDDELAAKA